MEIHVRKLVTLLTVLICVMFMCYHVGWCCSLTPGFRAGKIMYHLSQASFVDPARGKWLYII